MHCWGGHGRTGTVIAAFLVTCYGLSRQQAEDFYNAGEQARDVYRVAGNLWLGLVVWDLNTWLFVEGKCEMTPLTTKPPIQTIN